MPRSVRLADPDDLARQVRRAAAAVDSARALLLDVDGTLAPIAPTPEEATVPAGTLRALARLVDGGWTVAPVSGRPLGQVRRMLPLDGLLRFGSHGLEGEAYPGGSAPEVEAGARRLLDRLTRDAAEVVDGFPAVRVEAKPCGLAF
ncbi:MAG TPA: trehalose-phosphatase, partial [Candidatus Polarisedimenticolaceae bacterium]|nr:trehalose-phosphatase [Candidatus Polarisedimenticolaceae bacterium]